MRRLGRDLLLLVVGVGRHERHHVVQACGLAFFSSASACISRARRSISSWRGVVIARSPCAVLRSGAARQRRRGGGSDRATGPHRSPPVSNGGHQRWSAMLQKASSRARALRSRSSRSWRGVVIALPSLQKRTAVQCFGRGLTKSDWMAHKVLVHSIQIHPTELQQPAPPKRGLSSFGSSLRVRG